MAMYITASEGRLQIEEFLENVRTIGYKDRTVQEIDFFIRKLLSSMDSQTALSEETVISCIHHLKIDRRSVSRYNFFCSSCKKFLNFLYHGDIYFKPALNSELTIDETIQGAHFIERLPAPQYQLIKGNGSTWTKGSSQSLRFEAKRNGYDLAYVLFDHACIDGSTLSSSDYEISSGSIILDLRSSYLETLKPGTHTIELFFSDGSVNGTFTVHSPSSPAVPLPARKAIPDTGDPFSIRRWASLLTIGIIGTASSLFLLVRYHE